MPESSIILGKYELREVIGDGAEGRVYKACCIADDVPGVARGEWVALKRLKTSGHERESYQFRRQIEILRKLNHPNIVRYKDSFVWREKELEEDVYCLVMELLDGQTLKSLLSQGRGRLPWSEAKPIFQQILQALQYASRNSVIHRDLKPSNIHITGQGAPKLVDFGIARQDDGDATATSGAAGAKGTFDYMSPDFALLPGGFRGDEQSEIFSFGVLLYYTLTGRLPFPALGENPDRGYYIRWLGQSPPTPEFRDPAFRVLSHARTCIARCIDRDRKTRFGSFDELTAEFNQIGYRRLKHGAESYEFSEWLGKGGFGEVFRGRRASDQREVAIKRLFSSGQSGRFVREAKILRGAAHPNLTEYIDFVEVPLGAEDLEYYLVLEYLEGMPGASLRERIKQSESGLDFAETMLLFVSYLDCLEHLHRNGIIHRDIKPGNLYAPEHHPQRAKIFDLGIAHDEEGTRTHGQVPGTLDFMPPEFAAQASGRGSAQSDIYSIGVTLYLALTKKLPFPRLPEKESEAWVAFIRRAEAPLERIFDHPVFTRHPELVPLLNRTLAADPKRRFGSARAMRDEIRGLWEAWEKKQAYAIAMAAAQVALDQENYAEAEQQAKRALEWVPADPAARQALARARQGRLPAEEAPADADERPTAVTRMGAAGEPAEDATAATRPGDLEQMLASERAAQSLKKPEPPAPAAPRRRGPVLWTALAAAALVLAGGLYYLREQAQEKQAEAAAATSAARTRQAEAAAQAERDRKYLAAMDAAQSAYDQKAYGPAIEQAAAALASKPGDVAATRLTNDAQARQTELAALAERDRKYRAALAAGRAAYEHGQYGPAIDQAAIALALQPGDPAAIRLQDDVRARESALAAQAERDRKYRAALAAGRADYDQKVYGPAIEQSTLALANRPGDPAATQLRDEAQMRETEIAVQTERERKYHEAMTASQAAYDRGQYGPAIDQAAAALASQPGDPAATQLRAQAQAREDEIAAQAERSGKYRAAMAAGQAAYNRGEYGPAIDQAAIALALQPGDPAATKLQDDVQARKSEIAAQAAQAQAAQDQKPKAVSSARSPAYLRQNYSDAIAQAKAALALTNASMEQARLSPPPAPPARAPDAASPAPAANPSPPDDANTTKYHEAMSAGQSAYDRGEYSAAAAQAAAALAIKPGDPAAAKLQDEAKTLASEIAAQEASDRNSPGGPAQK